MYYQDTPDQVTPLAQAETGIATLLDRMHLASGDRVGLVTFDSGPMCGSVPLSSDPIPLQKAVKDFPPGFHPTTTLYGAPQLALQFLKASERSRDALPVVVVFSDFQYDPDELTSDDWTTLRAQLAAAGVRVITIGFDGDPDDTNPYHLDVSEQMALVASSPQDAYKVTDVDNIADVFASINLPSCADAARPPAVFAYYDQTVNHSPLPVFGRAFGALLPGGDSLLYSWSRLSGPGTVGWGTPTSPSTTVSFSDPGTHVLRFSVTDSLGTFQRYNDIAVVYDTFAPDNATPTPLCDYFVVQENSQDNQLDVLLNDSDPEGDPLTITSIVSGPNYATVTISGNKIVYTPLPDEFTPFYPPFRFRYSDSLTYEVSDGHGNLANGIARVAITPINHPPVANDDVRYVARNTGGDEPQTIYVLANDTDPDLGDQLEIISTTQLPPNSGSVTISGSIGRQFLEFIPQRNTLYDVTFSYTVRDLQGAIASANVTVHVVDPANLPQPPITQPDFKVLRKNSPEIFINVLANDSDPSSSSTTASK